MGNINYYEYLGISPTDDKRLTAEEVARLVQKQMVEVIKRLNGTGEQMSKEEKDRLKEQKDARDDMILFAQSFPKGREKPLVLPELSSADQAKAKILRKQQADEFKKERTEQMEKLAKLMFSDGQKEILQTRVKILSNKCGLDVGTAKAVFEKAGFKIIAKPGISADVFTSPITMKGIQTVLGQLQKQLKAQQSAGITMTVPIPDAIEHAHDLYDYLAAMRGGSAAELRDARRTAAAVLKAQFEEEARKHTRIGEPTESFRKMESFGTTVFVSEEERRKYDAALRLEPLEETVFSTVKELPNYIKADRNFAEMVIKKIRREFSDEELAIAIYNSYCDVPPELHYEKESTDVSIMCRCGNLNTFADLEIAKHARCHDCGIDLFRKCPNCGELNANSVDACSCGYYIPDYQRYQNYTENVKQAVSRENLPEAEEALRLAKACKPRTENLKALEDAVGRLRGKLATVLQELDTAIGNGSTSKARQMMAEIGRDHPKVDLSSYRKRLTMQEDAQKKELDWAASILQKAEESDEPSQKITACNTILQKIPDYSPAIQLLNSPELRPMPVSSVNVAKDDSMRAISVSWIDRTNLAILYTVVRKEGVNPPKSLMDGVKIAVDLVGENCRDQKDLRPGVVYSYSVFAVRRENVSLPAHGSAVILTPGIIGKPEYALKGMNCTLMWKDPPGSIGARVERYTAGKWNIVEKCRPSSLTVNLERAGDYAFRFTSVWSSGAQEFLSTQQQTVNVHMIRRPDPVTLKLGEGRKPGEFRLSWNAVSDFDLEFYQTDREIPFNSEIDRQSILGKPVAAAKTAQKSIYFSCGINKQTDVQVFSAYGSHLIAGSRLRLKSMQEVKVDWDNIAANKGQLSFHVTVPEGYRDLYVLVRKKEGSGATGSEEIMRNGRKIKVVGGDNLITCSDCPEDTLAIFVMAATAEGLLSPVDDDVYENLPKETISYNIEWKKVKRQMELSVKRQESGQNLPVKLYLCRKINNSGFMETAYSEAEMVRVAEITLTDMSGKLTLTREDLQKVGVKQGTQLKMFLKPAYVKSYNQPRPENAINLRCPFQP